MSKASVTMFMALVESASGAWAWTFYRSPCTALSGGFLIAWFFDSPSSDYDGFHKKGTVEVFLLAWLSPLRYLWEALVYKAIDFWSDTGKPPKGCSSGTVEKSMFHSKFAGRLICATRKLGGSRGRSLRVNSFFESRCCLVDWFLFFPFSFSLFLYFFSI